MKSVDATRALAIGAGAVIIALTGAAFWLSYAHLAEVALGHGLRTAPARAWAWPATLDLFIVAGELLMLRAALARRVDPWAIGLTAAGSVGSIVLNVAGVTGTRDPGAVPLLDYVVAAVPPTAALLAFGALMRQIHQALAERGEVTAAVAAEVTVERADDDRSGVNPSGNVAGQGDSGFTPAVPLEVVTRPVICSGPADLMPLPLPVSRKPVAVPAEQPRQVVTETIALTPGDLRRRARKLHQQVVTSGGRGVTIDQLREQFGLSRREATDLRRQVVTEVAS
ncbi:DUF2637 domain-containing protein [Streptomyces sp. NPDC015131]|uniref:DUF2637 domain-containing protein n=1 Tax=Streptomyces sp. NPDC015131 TaxID=3364941 RepID=UPI0037023D36